jgi:hypothetical protein
MKRVLPFLAGVVAGLAGAFFAGGLTGGGHGTYWALSLFFGPLTCFLIETPVTRHLSPNQQIALWFTAIPALYGTYGIVLSYCRRARRGWMVLAGMYIFHYATASMAIVRIEPHFRELARALELAPSLVVITAGLFLLYNAVAILYGWPRPSKAKRTPTSTED